MFPVFTTGHPQFLQKFMTPFHYLHLYVPPESVIMEFKRVNIQTFFKKR